MSIVTSKNIDELEKYNKNKDEAIHKLVKYIKILYKYLNDIDLCFIDGSFVIEDKDERMLDLLIVSSSLCLRHKPSHIKLDSRLFQKEINGIKYVTKNVCETHIEGMVINIKCHHLKNGKKIRNIKWFKFLNQKNENLIFLKLEETKACLLEHCKEEPYDDSGFKKNINALIINDVLDIEIKENYERFGDEFFISQHLNDFFLKFSENDKNIDSINIIKDIKTDIASIIGGKMI